MVAIAVFGVCGIGVIRRVCPMRTTERSSLLDIIGKKLPFTLGISLFWVSLWQLEIIEYCRWMGVKYNFGGLFYVANWWSARDRDWETTIYPT